MIERKQRTPTTVAEQHRRLVAALAQHALTGGDVEQDALVQAVAVVVEVATVGSVDRIARAHQAGHDVVSRHVAALVHDLHSGAGSPLRWGVQDAPRLHAVCRADGEKFPRDRRVHGAGRVNTLNGLLHGLLLLGTSNQRVVLHFAQQPNIGC